MSKEIFLPLVDGDIVAYECAFAGQFEEEGELNILPFRLVKEKIDKRVYDIMDALGTHLEPIMYLTGEGNFREEIAKRKGYKANRKDVVRPYHLANARVYLASRFNTATSRGCEADDLLAISQTKYNRHYENKESKVESVICTRDKDLRQVPGWHYGWEMGQQPEFRLQWVGEIGRLDPTYVEGVSKKTGKPTKSMKANSLKGTGAKWLYSQALMGDITDNIPGLKGYGQAKVYKIMNECTTVDEMIDVVVNAFKEVYEDAWHEELYEQVRLVYMIREQNEDASLKHWELPGRFYEAG